MPDPAATVAVCVITVETQPTGPLITVTVEDNVFGPDGPRRHSFVERSQALAAIAEFLSGTAVRPDEADRT
jgi:hypothetical protein